MPVVYNEKELLDLLDRILNKEEKYLDIQTVKEQISELYRCWSNQKITISEFQKGLSNLTGQNIAYWTDSEKILKRILQNAKRSKDENAK